MQAPVVEDEITQHIEAAQAQGVAQGRDDARPGGPQQHGDKGQGTDRTAG